jgi:uncharacterized protein
MTRLKIALLLSIAVVPTLTLVPLGSLWLWHNGLILPWVIGAFAFTSLMYAFAASRLVAGRIEVSSPLRPQTADASPKELAASAAVERLANAVDPATIGSRSDLLDLAVKTIEAVAREFHPDDKTPVWNFTVPELLLVTERVANRLRPMFVDNVPLGEHLKVGQMIRLYELRSMAGVAEGVYDLWRLVRAVNPLTAVTQEARERVTKHILTSLREDVIRRIVRMMMTEVGSAAIALYSGRLRAEPATDATAPAVASDPLQSESRMSSARTRLATAWREVRKAARGSQALYRRKRTDE